MPSKQVTDRSKSALAVAAAGRTHAADVATALSDLFSPQLEQGESMPDIELLIKLAARTLDVADKNMVAADEAHIRELADDAPSRDARYESADGLSDELVELREWLAGLYGAKSLERFGFAGPTPADPVALSRFAGSVVTALQDQKTPWPKPRQSGLNWDPSDTIARIESKRAELDKHIEDVAREVREGQATQRTKNDAIAAYDERFGRVATFLVGIFRLAGETALADRVRPSSRRRGQTAADEAPEGDPDHNTTP